VNKDTFFYEHIGHMQFSVLTLRTLSVLKSLTGGIEKSFVSWEKARKEIKKFGFSTKQAEGELDRFCYGFECMDRFSNSVHEIALTHIGIGFLKHLMKESSYQSSQIAFLARKARRKKHWNIIVQESTFFNPEIYQLISDFRFRSGGARDFIRSISIDELMQFLSLTFDSLSIAPNKFESSLESIITQVETYGKYWASVSGRYSWFVFTQRFELPFSSKDWELYDNLMIAMIRPPEWGGGKDILYSELIGLLEEEERLLRFRKEGIIRPIWTSQNIEKSKFRLTAPGYLMWERKKKGFLFEFCSRRLSKEKFELTLCNATDFSVNFLSNANMIKRDKSIPSFAITDTKDVLVNVISKIGETLNELEGLQQKVLF